MELRKASIVCRQFLDCDLLMAIKKEQHALEALHY